MNYTQEQQDILQSNGNIKINAVAGSGKTTTVIAYAASRPKHSRILYLAFNRSVKLEAEKKFREKDMHNVKVETAHSLAYKQIIPGSNYKVHASGYKTYEIAELLGIHGGGEKHAEFMIANHILKFLTYFCNSSKERLQDLNYLDVVTDPKAKSFVMQCYQYIETQTRLLLRKMEHGEIAVTHDFYLKKFQLAGVKLKYDYILFDEGQDASAAILDVFLKQEAVKVIVGDTHQQIYGWRYAVNSLEKVDFKIFHLSTSFRFNQRIADLANRVLSWKNHIREQEALLIKGEGILQGTNNLAVIARSNLGLLLEAINFIKSGDKTKRIYFEGNINSYTYAEDGASLYDVLNLHNGKRGSIKDKLIRTMRSMEDLEEYIQKTEDAPLGILFEIVKEYGNTIPGLLREIKARHVADGEKHKAEIVFSTVHRCKGMEYDAIQLANDFISEKKIIEVKNKVRDESAKQKLFEEINLLYVAVTRTRHSLHIHQNLLPEQFQAADCIQILRSETEADNNATNETLPEKADDEVPKSKTYTVEKMREKNKGAYLPWSKESDTELSAMFLEGKSIKQIAEAFGRSRGAISSRINKLMMKETQVESGH